MIPRYESPAIRELFGEQGITDTEARVRAASADAGGPPGFPAARGVRDTVLALQVVAGLDVVLGSLAGLRDALVGQAKRHAGTRWPRRISGRITGATSLGLRFAGWAAALDRDAARLRGARGRAAFGSLVEDLDEAGRRAEAEALKGLGLAPGWGLGRDRLAEVASALAVLGGNLEAMAVEARHLQRTDVGEAREPFRKGQTGSSAMPHKKNPITGERLTGMARLLRAQALALLQSQAPWHEGDDTQVPVDRVALADAFHLADYMLGKARGILGELHVYEGVPEENLAAAGHADAPAPAAEAVAALLRDLA